MADTSIEWATKVWNPTTGCDRISAGCDNCYALTMAKRLKGMGQAKYQTDGDPRTSGPGFGLALHPESLETPLSWKKPQRVFVNSMSDLFHARVPLDFQKDVFDVMLATPRHTYMVLTKRARQARRRSDSLPWPSNVWMGASVESQDEKHRIDDLRCVPAAVRFLSLEPLLEDLGPLNLDSIHWVIVGGESGPRARPIDLNWVRSIRDQCQASGTAFFYKQQGGIRPKENGRELDGREWNEYPEVAA